MRPTFMGFETAKSGIFYNQKALDIVSNNIANKDVNGYTRQRVETASVYVDRNSQRIARNSVGLAGEGVETLGVSQLRDSFLDKCFREQVAVANYHSQSASILNDVQGALTDGKDITDEDGLMGAIQKIYEALTDFAQHSTEGTQANIVMSEFKNISQVLQYFDSKLTTVTEQETYNMSLHMDRANEILSRVASINDQMQRDMLTVTQPDNDQFRNNALLDERNLLLDELASYVDTHVVNHTDGTADVSIAGHPVIEGKEQLDSLHLQKNKDGTVGVMWLASGQNVNLNQGTIKAYNDYINGRGNNVQNSNETAVQGILYYRDRLDTFAAAFAQIANSAIPEIDANGNVLSYYVDEAGVLYTDKVTGLATKYPYTAVLDDGTRIPTSNNSKYTVVATGAASNLAYTKADGIGTDFQYVRNDGTGAGSNLPYWDAVNGRDTEYAYIDAAGHYTNDPTDPVTGANNTANIQNTANTKNAVNEQNTKNQPGAMIVSADIAYLDGNGNPTGMIFHDSETGLPTQYPYTYVAADGTRKPTTSPYTIKGTGASSDYAYVMADGKTGSKFRYVDANGYGTNLPYMDKNGNGTNYKYVDKNGVGTDQAVDADGNMNKENTANTENTKNAENEKNPDNIQNPDAKIKYKTLIGATHEVVKNYYAAKDLNGDDTVTTHAFAAQDANGVQLKNPVTGAPIYVDQRYTARVGADGKPIDPADPMPPDGQYVYTDYKYIDKDGRLTKDEFDAAGNANIPNCINGRNQLQSTTTQSIVDTTQQVTAGNIGISTKWTETGSEYFIFSKDFATTKYALQLQNALTGKDTTFRSYGESYTGTFEEYLNDMVSAKLGTDVSFHEGRTKSTALAADDFQDQRDEVSAVSQDEETANMLIFQRAFQASSRVLTTMDDFLDTIINKMGRVGL